MLPQRQSPVKRTLLTVLTFFFSLVLLLQQSCKKTKNILPETAIEQVKENEQQQTITEKFFKLPANTGSAVQRVADEFKKQNNSKEFITAFAKKEGFAAWDKALVSIGKRKPGHLASGVESNGDTTVIIPLVVTDSNYVRGFILATVADTVSLNIYRNRDYRALPYAGSSASSVQKNVTTAENFAIRMMLLDNRVFGYTQFEIKDKLLFAGKSKAADTGKITRTVDFESNTNFKGDGSPVKNFMHIVCVTITTTTTTTSNHCPYAPGQCTGPDGTCDNCPNVCASVNTTYKTTTDCQTWDAGQGSEPWPKFPVTPGGNPGGGGTPPCTPRPVIVTSFIPANCPPIPNPWPGTVSCNMTEAQATAAINAITYETTTTTSSKSGTPLAPDINGIIRAPKPCSGGGFTLHILPGYNPHWEASYAGIIYKTSQNARWKWESFIYSGFPMTESGFPPCVSGNMVASGVSTVISADKSHATGAGNYALIVNWTCVTRSVLNSYTGLFSATFSAN